MKRVRRIRRIWWFDIKGDMGYAGVGGRKFLLLRDSFHVFL